MSWKVNILKKEFSKISEHEKKKISGVKGLVLQLANS